MPYVCINEMNKAFYLGMVIYFISFMFTIMINFIPSFYHHHRPASTWLCTINDFQPLRHSDCSRHNRPILLASQNIFCWFFNLFSHTHIARACSSHGKNKPTCLHCRHVGLWKYYTSEQIICVWIENDSIWMNVSFASEWKIRSTSDTEKKGLEITTYLM